MELALQMLLGQPAILTLLVVGVAASVAVVALAVRGVRRLDDESAKLVALARSGRADEARIQARQGPRDMAPILAALGGELATPSPRPFVRDLVAALGVSIFPILVMVAAWQSAALANAAERVAGISASFLALSILLPVTFAAATLVITFGRRGARVVRGAAVQLLSRSVKIAVDAELSETLRRGGHRDPRGE